MQNRSEFVAKLADIDAEYKKIEDKLKDELSKKKVDIYNEI